MIGRRGISKIWIYKTLIDNWERLKYIAYRIIMAICGI